MVQITPTPPGLINYLQNGPIKDRIVILTDNCTDFYVIDKERPEELIMLEGTDFDTDLASKVRLGISHHHSFYGTASWEAVINFYIIMEFM